jgi:hypothetical protein
MRKRLAAVGLGAILGANAANAQPPPFPVAPPQFPMAPQFPAQPQFPAPPRTPPLPPAGLPPVSTQPQFPAPAMPGPLTPPQPLPPQLLPPPAAPGVFAPGAPPNQRPNASPSPIAEAPLPQPEQRMALSAMDVQVKRVVGGWQVWAGQKVLRDLGENEIGARDLVRVFRDLRPTEWVTIGGPKPVVEYGLTNGRPALAVAAPDAKADPNAAGANVNQASLSGPIVTGAGAKVILPIDLRAARAEAIRGVWCVRDDENLLLNFGTDKAGAEQAIAVIRKYGFNRVGVVGDVKQPVMSYLFASLEADRPKIGGGQLLFNAQVDALARTGIPVPGVGYTGEMVKIDPRKVEARKDGAEWVVMAGPEVLGHFGPTEWAAREAARTVQDARYTEFCRLGGTSGLTFFLRDGKAPTRAPFSAQGRNFDPAALKVQPVNGKWAVTEGGRHLFDVSGPQEGEIVARVLKAYGFDQMATLSSGGSKGGIAFMVKSR